ncbi:hypothetical protein D9611_005086 [Ephemerocybe angulata]|uniref:Uncharacterized protein n=1 Tax=Ephemerocybe angulata TaxID=980116 RepID=A0A8H5C061_9AGAR|nr:hypothetical protein D9611_005086 [Tulosesus angulatus]
MPMTLLLDVSRSSLLHASLANLTPELLALDAIITTPIRRRLPTELLLIVRGHLLLDLITSLVVESTKALASYEESLISLLCTDCASYNTDIYGASVWEWPWDQFSGPCLCRGDIDECMKRTKAFTDDISRLQCDADKGIYLRRIAPLFRRAESGEVFAKGELLQFSPQLLDAGFFLELYLSRQARRLARLAVKEDLKTCGRRSSSESSKFLRVRTIWDAAGLVLEEKFGCEAIPLKRSYVTSTSTPSSTNFRTPPVVLFARPIAAPSTGSLGEHGAEIIELDEGKLESLREGASVPPKDSFFFKGPYPLSTTSRGQRDRVYIFLIPNGQPEDDSSSRHPGPSGSGDGVRRLQSSSEYGCDGSIGHSGETQAPSQSMPVDNVPGATVRATLETGNRTPATSSIKDPWLARTLLKRTLLGLGLDDRPSDQDASSVSTRSSHSASSETMRPCNDGPSSPSPSFNDVDFNLSEPSTSPLNKSPATKPYLPATPPLEASPHPSALCPNVATPEIAANELKEAPQDVVAGLASLRLQFPGEVAIGGAGVSIRRKRAGDVDDVVVGRTLRRAEATSPSTTTGARCPLQIRCRTWSRSPLSATGTAAVAALSSEPLSSKFPQPDDSAHSIVARAMHLLLVSIATGVHSPGISNQNCTISHSL